MKTESRLVSYAILCIAAMFVLGPLAWAISTSFKDFAEATAYPPRCVPLNPTFENFQFVFTSEKLQRYFLNSFEVILLTILVSLLLSVPAAYAVERGKFGGKRG
jgi:ABC-type glycerol-3-phosphate transport system permease component